MKFIKYIVMAIILAMVLSTSQAAYLGSSPLVVLDSAGSNFASIVNAINAAKLTSPLAIQGLTATDGSTTITSGGAAQNLFSGSTPSHGWEVCNPGLTDDLWVSDTTTAAPNTAGSFRVQLNGGCVISPIGSNPIGVVSVYGATTLDPITARKW